MRGWQAKSMKRWHSAVALAPLRMPQYWTWSIASFHSMASDAPLSAGVCSRPFQMLPSTTSLSVSIWGQGPGVPELPDARSHAVQRLEGPVDVDRVELLLRHAVGQQ